MTAPTIVPPRPDPERLARAEALTAQLRERVADLNAFLAPLRAEMDQARASQRSVLEFVTELWEREGFSCSFEEDSEEATRLCLDALATVRLLLTYEGQNLPPECWAKLEDAMDELDHTYDCVHTDYQQLQALLADGGELD